MKNLLQTFLVLILGIVVSPVLKAQNLYELDLFNSSISCTTTCGVLNPAHWRVSGNQCSLTTSEIYYPTHAFDSAMVAPVSVTLTSIGNFTCGATHSEGALVSSSVNNGPWFTQSRINPCQLTGSYTTSFKLQAPAGASVKLMVTLVVSGNNSKQIRVNNGNIIIGEAVVASPTNWVKSADDPEHNSAICRFTGKDRPISLIKESTTGILQEGSTAATFKVFPNPATGNTVQVQITGSKEDEVLVTLHDLLGIEHYSRLLVNRNGDFLEAIDCGKKLTPGVYLITGTSKSEFYRQTLVVK